MKAEPDSLSRNYLGMTYRRWFGYMNCRPLDELTEVDIPILAIHGNQDMIIPIESSRVISEEIHQAGKNKFKIY